MTIAGCSVLTIRWSTIITHHFALEAALGCKRAKDCRWKDAPPHTGSKADVVEPQSACAHKCERTGKRCGAIVNPCRGFPATSDVLVRLDEDVTSKRTKVDDPFRASVATAVMRGGVTVIPRGATVTGRIAYRTGKGAFGKSAKMEIEFVSVSVDGQQHPLTGKFREEGRGNTGATVGAAVAAGPFAAFVTGRSATFARDREFWTATREPISISY